MTDPIPEKVIRLYRSGLSIPRVAERLRIPPSRVYQILLDNNIPRRPVGRHNGKPERNRQIVDEFLAGDKKVLIAWRHKISIQRVDFLLRRDFPQPDTTGAVA